MGFVGQKEKIFLALDIGTEAVKTLIFSIGDAKERKEKNEERKITILGAGLKYFERYDVFDGKNFEVDVIKRGIEEAIEQAYQSLFFSSAEKELKKRAQKQKKWQLFLTLSANILKGRIASSHFYRENPKKKISKKEERVINQRVSKLAQRTISQRFAKETGILVDDIHWVSLRTLGVKINGYPVSGLQGYDGRDLEFNILATFLPKYYLENIKRITKDLKLELSRVVHSAETLPEVFREGKDNGIFLDVGGEITQIFLVKAGKLQKVQEFKIGGKRFSQALSRTLGIDEENSRILKERYSNKLLSAETKERVKDILVQQQREWYEGLKSKIKEIKGRGVLSSAIFLFGGGSRLPEVREILEKEAVVGEGELPDSETLKVRFIYPKDLKNIKDTTKNLNNPQYISPLLMCYHAQKDF